MTNPSITSTVENDNVLVLEREFNAPRELVFRMFKEAEHLKHWWGPSGWELPVCTVDFQPGGVWHYCMKCVDKNQGDFFGMESWGKAVYGEIVEPEKIVYTDFFSDAEGNVNEELPSTEVTLLFVDLDGGRTKLINRGVYASAESLQTVLDMGMLQGISQTWDRLDARLESLQ
jgi:uncharacterized protein YndB with AHSA1/START domain